MDLEDADLGLLLALEALLREGNVTRAAASLQIRQSTLSARLARLRKLLGDPLFVPAASGRGVVPTPRAAALQSDLAAAMAALRRIAGDQGRFDPARTTRSFVIACPERPAIVLGPALLRDLLQAAPGCRLAFVAPGADIAERLERGEADLLIAGPDQTNGQWRRRALLADPFVVAQRQDHPRGRGPLDLDTYCTLRHVMVSARGDGFSGTIDDALARQGRRRQVVASVQSYALAPLLVAATDIVCTLPASMLTGFAAMLDFAPPPLEIAPAQLFAVWHPRSQHDAGHVWLRERLYAAAALGANGMRLG